MAEAAGAAAAEDGTAVVVEAITVEVEAVDGADATTAAAVGAVEAVDGTVATVAATAAAAAGDAAVVDTAVGDGKFESTSLSSTCNTQPWALF